MLWYVWVGLAFFLLGWWRIDISLRDKITVAEARKRMVAADKEYEIPRELTAAEAYWLAKHFELAGVKSVSHHPPHQREAMKMLAEDQAAQNDPFHVGLGVRGEGFAQRLRYFVEKDDSWGIVKLYDKLFEVNHKHPALDEFADLYVQRARVVRQRRS